MNNSKEKSFAHDLIYYTITHIIPILAGFIMVPIYTGVFTTEQYGNYSLITSTVSVSGILCVTWINISYSRFYNHMKDDNSAYQLTVVSLASLMIMTLLMGMVFYLMHLKGMLSKIVPDEFFYSFLGLLLITNIYSFYNNYLKVLRKVEFSTILSGIAVAVRFVVFVILVYGFGMRVSAFLAADAASHIVFMLLMLLKEKRKRLPKDKWKIKYSFIREYYSYGIPFIFIQGVHWILTLSDRYMIKFLKDSSQVGIYSANYSFAEKIIMPVITIFMSTAEPIVFQKLAKVSLEEADKALNKIFKYFLALAVPAAVGLSMTSKEFAAVFIKNEFREGYVVIPLISMGMLFLGVRQYTNKGLEIAKKSKNIAYISFIAAAVNIILNFVLIPPYGYVGAAVATLIAYIVYCIVSYFRLNKLSTVKVKFGMVHFKIIASSAIMAVFVKGVDLLPVSRPVMVLAIKVAVGVVVYSILIYIFGVFGSEIKSIKDTIIRKFMRKSNASV